MINMQSGSREANVVQSQLRSDCYPILLNMQRHSRETTVIPRRRGVAASINYISASHQVTVTCTISKCESIGTFVLCLDVIVL